MPAFLSLLSPTVWKWVGILVIIVGLIGAAVYEKDHIYNEGYTAGSTDVKKAVSAELEAELAVQNKKYADLFTTSQEEARQHQADVATLNQQVDSFKSKLKGFQFNITDDNGKPIVCNGKPIMNPHADTNFTTQWNSIFQGAQQ